MYHWYHLSSLTFFRIEYTVTPFTTAVQWLTREQTFGKTKPFLFTQLQPIHARSLFPCQDTPSVKATYTASVHVDSGLVPVMSAILQSHDLETSTFFFRQNIPIPVGPFCPCHQHSSFIHYIIVLPSGFGCWRFGF